VEGQKSLRGKQLFLHTQPSSGNKSGDIPLARKSAQKMSLIVFYLLSFFIGRTQELNHLAAEK